VCVLGWLVNDVLVTLSSGLSRLCLARL